MAFILRQFQEGDRFFSVQNVGNTAGVDCWVDELGNYKDSFLSVEVNGTSYPLLSSNIISLGLGYLHFTLPAASGLTSAKVTTSLQLKTKCSSEVSDIKTALPIDFTLNLPSNVFVCNEIIQITPVFKDRVRLFFAPTSPNNAQIAKIKLNDSAFVRSMTSLESGYTNNADTNSTGDWREVLHSGNSIYWSNLLYTPTNVLYIKPATLNYFSARLGYVELLYTNSNVTLVNTLNNIQTNLGAYTINDEFLITSTSGEYLVSKNGVVIQRISKTVNLSVTGGTLTANSTVTGTPVLWNLPLTEGSYDVNVFFNDVLLIKTINLQNCIENKCELRHKLDGFEIKCCSEGQVEIYRNHVRVAVIDLNILGEGVYKTKIDGYYQLKAKCNNIWGELSPYQYYSFADGCKPKNACGCNEAIPSSETYLTSTTAQAQYIPKTGSNQLSGSFVPNVLNTVNLGSVEFPINKLISNEVAFSKLSVKDSDGLHIYDVTGVNEIFSVNETGKVNFKNKVGILNNNPTATLDITGTLNVTGESTFKNSSRIDYIGAKLSVANEDFEQTVIVSPSLGIRFANYEDETVPSGGRLNAHSFKIYANADNFNSGSGIDITSTGNVGIGIVPTAKLHVNGPSLFNNELVVDYEGAAIIAKDVEFDNSISLIPEAGIVFGSHTNWNTIASHGKIRGLSLKLYADTVGIDVSTTGNVGINKAVPTARLHVDGSVRLDSQTVTTAAATPATHKFPVNINGTVYYLLMTT